MLDIYLSKGNIKLSNKILIFSLPAIKTCPKSINCQKYCYARKAEKRFPNVLLSRQRNFESSKSPDFIKSIIRLLRKQTKRYNYCRIHESGDFYSEEYFNKWINIVKELHYIQFYAYTKTSWHKNIKLPNNLNIISSYLPKRDNNIFEYIKEFDRYKNEICNEAFLCPTVYNHDIICGENCKYCIEGGQYVAFIKH